MSEEKDNNEKTDVLPKDLGGIKTLKSFKKLTTNHCKMCAHPEKHKWEELLSSHKATQKEAGSAMGFSDQLVSDHMKNHFGQAVAAVVANSPVVKQMAESVDDASAMLKGYLTELTKRGNQVMNLPIDAKSEFAIKAHISEVRELVKLLAELHGNLQQAPSVNIVQINNEYNDFRNKIISILCPQCKKRLVDEDI